MESFRIPLLLRYSEAVRQKVVHDMVLNIDLAPTILDLTGIGDVRPPMQGRSDSQLFEDKRDGWWTSWYYQYDLEKEFPYTPNVRALRTADWKYIHYPNGAGQADTETAELYHLTRIRRSSATSSRTRARTGSAPNPGRAGASRQTTGGLPDRMPTSPKLSFEMPAASIR